MATDNPIITAWEDALDREHGCEERQSFIAYLKTHYGRNLQRFMEMDCREGVDHAGTED